ncbi:MAG: pilus assembly protein PilP [Pseudomonadota bacterium]
MRAIALSLLCLTLAACSGEHEDIKEWMKESTKNLQGRVQPLPEIKVAAIAGYEAADLIDPFQPRKIEPDKKPGSGIMPDLNRRKEPLEAYPLESLKMVGTLMMGKMVHAVIQADKTLHQVKIGNYMGQNFGMVTEISESEVVLKELVQDATGEYTERTSVLQLQENQEPKK